MNTLPTDGSLFRAAGERSSTPSIFDITAPVAPAAGVNFRDHLRPPATAPAEEATSNKTTAPAASDSQRQSELSQEGNQAAPLEETQQVAAAGEEVPAVNATEDAPAEDAVAESDIVAEEALLAEEIAEVESDEQQETTNPAVAAIVVEAETTEEPEEAPSEAITKTETTQAKQAQAEGKQTPIAEVPAEGELASAAESEATEAQQGTLVEATSEGESEGQGEAEASGTKKTADGEGSTTKATKELTQPAAIDAEQASEAAESESTSEKPPEKRDGRRGARRTGSATSTKNDTPAANQPGATPAVTETAQAETPAEIATAEIAQVAVEATSEEAKATGSEAETKPVVTKSEQNAAAPANETNPRNVLGPRRATAAGPGEVQLTPAERGQFVQRVTRAIETAQERGGPIRIRLSPPELGSVRVELTIEKGVMNARLEAESPQAQQLLVENLTSLKERLADHQIRIEQFEVELSQQQTGEQTFQHETGDRQPQHTGRAAGRGTLGSGGESETATETTAPGTTAEGHRLNVVV